MPMAPELTLPLMLGATPMAKSTNHRDPAVASWARTSAATASSESTSTGRERNLRRLRISHSFLGYAASATFSDAGLRRPQRAIARALDGRAQHVPRGK